MATANSTLHGRAIAHKMTELGRIRIGDREPDKSGPGTHPHKLDTFRLTSPNSPLLHFAASLYGGNVQPWTGEGAPKDDHGRPTQFELYTTANALDVLIPTFSAAAISFERWSAGGCQVRCTGEFITHSPLDESRIGLACECPPDDQARAELAKAGKACARILRLNVILPDLPGMGGWRLETKGFYATAELMGTLDMLQMAGQEHSIIEAVLRLEARQVKRPGKGKDRGTLKFVVPCLWPKYTPRQLLASAAQRGALLMAPPVQLPAAEQAAQATDALFGDGAGDVFRPPATVLPTELSYVAIKTIEEAHQHGGREIDWIARYWQKMCTRFHVESPAAMPFATLQGLAEEVRAYYATQKPGQEPRDTGKEASSAPDSATETSSESGANLEPASGQKPPSPAEPSWKLTLRAHRDTLAQMAVAGVYTEEARGKIEELVEQIDVALSPLAQGAVSDENGFALASATLEWIDAAEEQV